MQFKILSSLGVCVKDNGFSIDELVMRLDALFQEKGFPGIVAQILMLVDENLALRAMDGRELPVKCPRCGKSLFVLDGYRSRRFGTRLGTVELPSAHRAKCRHCGHSCVPLFLLCGIGRHQSASDGLQKMAIEQCVETSYRRAAGNPRALAGVVRSHTSFHRWVLKTDADEIKVPEDAVDAIREPAAEEGGPPGEDSGVKKEPASLFADGTRYKGRTAGGHARAGTLKALVGVREDGRTFAIGAWADKSWEDIGRELEERKLRFADGSILVTDGEQPIADGLAALAGRHQRCQWHVARDLYFSMHEQGASAADVRPWRDRLWQVMGVELPSEDYDVVPEGVREDVGRRLAAAESGLRSLIAEIRKGGFGKAAEYLENASRSMFGYVRRWLDLGISCPRASSLIERVMRELGRRVKKLAYGWKPKGIEKVTRILLRIFTDEEEWEKYWRERMRISQSVALTFRIVKAPA